MNIAANNAACCAHLKVYWTTQTQDKGQTRGWWQCGDCWTRFVPVVEFTFTSGAYSPGLDPSAKIGQIS